MDNHPIPQDVTGFKFRIVGSITVRQFMYLLGSGIAAAILIFLVEMNLIFKIPLIVLLGGVGPFFAFIPIEGRAADLMLVSFFRAVFSNSLYIYQKQGANLALFPAFSFAAPQTTAKQSTQSKSDIKRALLARTLRSSTYAPDNEETERIHKINESFQGVSGGVNTAAPSIVRPPVDLNNGAGSTNQEEQANSNSEVNNEVVRPRTTPSLVVDSIPSVQSTNNTSPAQPQQTTNNNQADQSTQTYPPGTQASSNTRGGQPVSPTVTKESISSQVQSSPAVNNNQQTSHTVTPIDAPRGQIASAAGDERQQKTGTQAEANVTQKDETTQTGKEAGHTPKKAVSEFFDALPDRPNVILGVVLDPRGKVLSNIIVEVEDKSGTPVRTFKTNAQGKFAAATSLPDGEYIVKFEDPRGAHKFATINVALNGAIFEPILVKSVDAREELRQNLFGK